MRGGERQTLGCGWRGASRDRCVLGVDRFVLSGGRFELSRNRSELSVEEVWKPADQSTDFGAGGHVDLRCVT